MKCCSLHEVLSFINLLVKNKGGGEGRVLKREEVFSIIMMGGLVED